MKLGLMYGQIPIDLALYNLTGYANSNFAKYHANQKSIMKYYIFLNKVVILWNNKK